MWPKFYRDYEVDKPLIKNRVEASKGIIGCEMHELNGWGNEIHVPWGSHHERLIHLEELNRDYE